MLMNQRPSAAADWRLSVSAQLRSVGLAYSTVGCCFSESYAESCVLCAAQFIILTRKSLSENTNGVGVPNFCRHFETETKFSRLRLRSAKMTRAVRLASNSRDTGVSTSCSLIGRFSWYPARFGREERERERERERVYLPSQWNNKL